MKFRIEEIVLRAVKADVMSVHEGSAIVSALMFAFDTLADKGEQADAFEQTFGSFTANNIRHLCEEKP